jgi:hypothetical protein
MALTRLESPTAGDSGLVYSTDLMRFKEQMVGTVATLASVVLAAALPAAAAPSAGMQYLVGTWNCTYRAGAMHMGYGATYTSDLGGHALREIASYTGGGDEELIAYDAPRGWTAVVLDDHGNATIMHATSKDPNHVAYSSVYPDKSIAVKFDRVSATEYTLHGTVRAGGKTITSVDTCLRRAH